MRVIDEDHEIKNNTIQPPGARSLLFLVPHRKRLAP